MKKQKSVWAERGLYLAEKMEDKSAYKKRDTFLVDFRMKIWTGDVIHGGKNIPFHKFLTDIKKIKHDQCDCHECRSL